MQKDCYSGLEDINCKNQFNSSAMYYNGSCIAIEEFCKKFDHIRHNETHCFQGENIKAIADIYNRTLSSEEYFRYDFYYNQRCIVSEDR